VRPLRKVPCSPHEATVGHMGGILVSAQAVGDRPSGQTAGFRLFLGRAELLRGRDRRRAADKKGPFRRALELIT
jgi:hypothetical protein